MPIGTITYLNQEKGYGFIEGVSGDVFFHATRLHNGMFSSLYVGQECDYLDMPGEKTRVATSVSPLGGDRAASTAVLFLNVFPGNGEPPKRVRFPANTIISAEDGTRFRLTQGIRQGGNGVVFRADRLVDGDAAAGTCAVKLLKHLEPQRIDRFMNEIRVLQCLDHEFISPYHSHGKFDIDGVSLPWTALALGGDNLRNHIDNQGPIDVPGLKTIVPQMCSALQHLHEKGFIHRDIKPDNFVWTSNTSTDTMMIDFGLAKRLDEDISGRPLDGFTKHLEFVGPVFFSSPELIAYARDKSHPVDHRSDLFQLGKVIWFLATGDISAGVPSRRKDPTGGGLHALVMDLLQDDPDDRVQGVAVVGDRIRAI
jgi:cold shock CspA family protein